jgi:hypothetical protein
LHIGREIDLIFDSELQERGGKREELSNVYVLKDVHTEETTPRFAQHASQSIEFVLSYVITRLKANLARLSHFHIYHHRRFPFTTQL